MSGINRKFKVVEQEIGARLLGVSQPLLSEWVKDEILSPVDGFIPVSIIESLAGRPISDEEIASIYREEYANALKARRRIAYA